MDCFQWKHILIGGRENWGNLMEETKQYGYFQLIVQLMGVALHHSNEREVVDLFEWGDS